MQHLTIVWQVVAPEFEPPRSCRKFSSAKYRFDSRIMLHARYLTPHRPWCKCCCGEGVSGLFGGVVSDFALRSLRQRLLQFSNLCLGEVG